MRLKIALLAALASGAMGCASARMLDEEATRMFRRGEYSAAADRLKKGLSEQGENSRDELLYLLDIGLSLHAAGKFEESNQAFLRADKIAEIKDYTSLATEAGTLLVSENVTDYKGEDFEKVLINTYLSMNYALMGDRENALVEARRVNRKLYLMITDGQRKYKQNAFARYLSAVLYEAEGDWNDAYIDYKETHKIDASFPGLGRDLWRGALATGIREDLEKWDEEFKLTEEDHKAARLTIKRGGSGAKGEIIVLYENGISPIKQPSPNFYSIPKFYPRSNPVGLAHVRAVPAGKDAPRPRLGPAVADAGGTGADTVPAPLASPVAEADTATLHNIETTAIENLDEKYAGIVAKKVAGVLAKEVVADQIGRHTDPAIGQIMRLVLYASDQADCRSWNLLPKDLQLARLVVEPGTYNIQVQPVGAGVLPEKLVQVGAGKKIFVNFRYMP